MALVDYSSDSDDNAHPPPSKKQKRVSGSTLPPLPSTFRDLYSSTVRTSTQDDPSLHAGRKRATPHIAGNWPAHVYLEWFPEKEEHALLCRVVEDVRNHVDKSAEEVQSLLQNDLGVQMPLHVSLSRPLSLKTEQKDRFHGRLKSAIGDNHVREFSVQPTSLVWHPNEDGKRWFLVLKLGETKENELPRLLATCNDLASEFDQPLLYEDHHGTAAGKDVQDSHKFHVSIAWSLHTPRLQDSREIGGMRQGMSDDLQDRATNMCIDFSEVKIRIGQDVSTIALPRRRVRRPSSSAHTDE